MAVVEHIEMVGDLVGASDCVGSGVGAVLGCPVEVGADVGTVGEGVGMLGAGVGIVGVGVGDVVAMQVKLSSGSTV